ncbi:amino acid ABC transporter permease [Litchfieldia salsa]|uniref:Amino acid ABC transporter membrane protein 1, PAAT family n=1 Tax=Litchfieldia salsa TaxID=930152 RepID=A0A1H0WYM5_9BACI|nr:ABC transporter permease subunit [Litchfieldia salsa]SDP95346.1 amino acid ABC transporter membrane protein 1, PAAT family [Litchfieldia salsa]
MAKNTSTVTTPFWRNKKIIPILLQILFTIVVFIAGYYFVTNAIAGLNQMGMKLGFDFLKNTASFSISEALIEYAPTDTYGRALLVGLLNTLRVAFFGIIFASIIGVVIGVSRLSNNWLLSKLATVYIEVFRNTPLLVQIFIWYFAVFLTLPRIEEAVNFGPFYFSNRGAAIPWFETHGGSLLWIVLTIAGVVFSVITYKYLMKKEVLSGKRNYPVIFSLSLIFISFLVAFSISGAGPVNITTPVVEGKAYVGGYTISETFAAILVALVIYTSTFIAEIVRAGIMGVPKGQVEAAKALGFKNSTALRLVIFPQAIRIIIPPLTSQYLNLIKNSSLAIAVGYQDIVSVSYTTMNQTGRAVEGVVIMIIVYLTFSIVTSLFMNFFNKKFQLVER